MTVFIVNNLPMIIPYLTTRAKSPPSRVGSSTLPGPHAPIHQRSSLPPLDVRQEPERSVEYVLGYFSLQLPAALLTN